jgi:CBS domain-containing protein
MKTGFLVADIMTTKPLTVSSSDSIKKVAELMKQYDVTSMLITDHKKVVGIVTGKDFVFKAVAEGFSSNQPVSSIMSKVLYTVTPRLDIVDALKKMNEYNVRHLPVMEGEKLVGYITMSTILKIEPQLFELFAEKIELRCISPDSSMIDLFDGELSGQCESCGNYSSKLIENKGRVLCLHCVSGSYD